MWTQALQRVSLLGLVGLVACQNSPAGPPGSKPQDPSGTDPKVDGQPVAVVLAAEQQAEVERLSALLAETKDLTGEALREKRALPFRPTLGYDPNAAMNFDLVQASALRLEPSELEIFGKNGFVISDRRRFPHFAEGYLTIYGEDLPVFVSADSILQAVHQSYDDILKALELEALIPEMRALLGAMRSRLPALEAPDVTKKDTDLFLAVALSLLDGAATAPVAGASRSEIETLLAGAQAASGSRPLDLFGAKREVDFSQFKPRGHYTGEPMLENYFRAMMWLGRIDFPMLQTDGATGQQVLVRRGVAAALALRGLMDEAAFARWQRLDATVRAFVGEPDSMAPSDVDGLRQDLGLSGHVLGDISDEVLAKALVAGSYGHQRILSQIVIQAPHTGPWPLDATFLFFGQRYVFDSHVFSNVVYDRTPTKRMMPNPLDVAYAALGNDQAAALLAAELDAHPYAGALESIRLLGDEHGDPFWNANLYNLWLGALRALSPGADLAKAPSGLPAVATTEPWGRRLLSTQLASWAQLRHDTILYAKQSYTSGIACEFPDAYVEPYPAFFGKIVELAAKGSAVVAELPLQSGSYLGPRIASYFYKLGKAAGILKTMAEHQRTGVPHTPEHLAFINQAVSVQRGCGGPGGITGWYADLFFDPSSASTFDPTIADVHTQPTDEFGNPVGKVLHVGTGWARLMVMTVDTCMGPRAYAGVVSSYHELVTEKLERLDDEAWAKRFTPEKIPADVPWMEDLIAR